MEWKDTVLKGTLRSTTTNPPKFYLLGSSDEAITLEVPTTVNLTTLVGKRILAIGTYNSKDKILKVTDVQDLEVLPITQVPIPTSSPTVSPITSLLLYQQRFQVQHHRYKNHCNFYAQMLMLYRIK